MQGLGLTRLSKQRVVPPFQAALPQLDAPLFSLWLNPNTAPSATAGALVLGGLQPARCAGPLAWHPVVSDRRASTHTAQSCMHVVALHEKAMFIPMAACSWLSRHHHKQASRCQRQAHQPPLQRGCLMTSILLYY